MAKEKKKLGSVSNIPEKEKKPFWDRIWDYKPYLIVSFIIILLIVIYFSIFKNMGRNPEAPGSSPAATTKAVADTGTLKVVTDPTGTRIQFKKDFKLAPATFKNVPEGEHILILSLPGYKTVEKTVKIEKNKTITLKYKMQK